MELVLIPSGEFEMGAGDTDDAAEEDEYPRHRVRLTEPFRIGRTEVTYGQFKAFVEETKYETYAEASGLGGNVWSTAENRIVEAPSMNWRNPENCTSLRDDLPVTQVTRDDAMKFCKWLGTREKATYRLPTEAEWEYCARAGTSTRWCAGNDPAELEDYAWIVSNSGYVIHPVGKRKPNAFGLFDMHGNVWEWCMDWDGPYSDRLEINPTGPAFGSQRVVRGGAYDWLISKTRSSYRGSSPQCYRYMTNGFRVVRSVNPIEAKLLKSRRGDKHD